MSSIQPIGIGSGGAIPTRPTASAPATSPQAPTGGIDSGAGAAGTSGSTTAIMNLASQVTQMLSSLGGGLENDKMMRMMIALIILMALMNEQQEGGSQQEGAQGAGRGLAQSGGSGDQSFIYQSYSVTSISIQQTSYTSVAYGAADAFSSGGADQNSGGQLDLSI